MNYCKWMVCALTFQIWAGNPVGPHEILNPTYVDRGLSGTQLAWDYLDQNTQSLGIDLGSLILEDVQQSLLGTHYEFQQYIDDVPLFMGQIVVSVDAAGKIYRVSNHAYTETASFNRAKVTLTTDDALDLAWQDLNVVGELLEQPKADLGYLGDEGSFQLVYRTRIAVEKPYGYWQHTIDALSGKILEFERYDLSRVPQEPFRRPEGPALDRVAAQHRYESLEMEREALNRRSKSAVLVDGSGQVFDPDPRTTLLDDNLQDGSPASAFTTAYFTKTLPEITNNAGTFILDGPWILIRDFESPATAPSTTMTGTWTATRGDNAFNDANTYFHIDQNQRYIQSLGFIGGSGIQQGPIQTDTDGLNGGDNSHYIPGTNRMAFGHGCVDDNEDQFVILHEYGHAIHHSINPSNWSGGDTGAMGEGFGDYWAASYRHSTPNGPAYHPEWAFPWDGHGTGNLCWNGRILNAFAAQYVHTTFYGAHSAIPGGFQSDELWSTPLFQSHLEILNQGGTREECDAIILESHFGIAAGPKMRDMANRIIQTAEMMYPLGPHKQIFIDKFLVHNIIDLPVVILAFGDVMVTDPGVNGFPDPGETVQLDIRIDNNGTLGCMGVSGLLTTTTPGVNITSNSSTYPDIALGSSAMNNTSYVVEIDPGFVCGDPIDFNLAVDYQNVTDRGLSTNLGFSITTGEPLGASQSVSPGLAILDNQTIMSPMTIVGTGATVSANFNVDINISHTFIGDLIVDLESPMGTVVRLHNRTGGTAEDIIGNYPLTLTPAESLSGFIGDPLDGEWTLIVSDNANGDEGTLNSWGINDVSGYDCEAAVNPCTFATFPQVIALWAETSAIYDFNGSGFVDMLDLLAYTLMCP
ncbi:MAG: proprotein convertase P-domain-containing protein [Acidobacteria bacterium]|nr:proprotein convertase P-domain-containing protein [Acidobacteriota bacterium]